MQVILKAPKISEKSMKQAATGLYTFLVDKKARKPEIIIAVKKAFGVDVLGIKTINFKSEEKYQRSRKGTFIMPGYKKAMIQVKNGQKIALFETAVEEKEPEVKAETKEKKSLLKGTKVKIERAGSGQSEDQKIGRSEKKEDK